MKKVSILLFLLSFFFYRGHAQPGDTLIQYGPSFEKRDWIVIDLNYAGWMNPPANIKTKPYSYNINLAYIYDIPFGTSPLGIGIGVGFSSQNVYHNGNFYETPNGDTKVKAYHSSLAPSKNKLSTNYLDVPLELRFRTKGETPFRITAGIKAGYLVNSHEKVIFSGKKSKYYHFPNMRNYHYGTVFRIGYGIWNLNAYYSLSSLFEEGAGPDITPFSAGLSLTFF